jgi:GT2 family glycosyltransferase
MTGTTVAGIVVNYRTPKLTTRAVRTLLDDGAAEVVVVDNSVEDPGSSVLREMPEHDTRVRYQPMTRNAGFGQGVNAGAAATAADSLFVLNSDAEVVPGATAALAGALDDPTVAIAAPFVRAQDGGLQTDSYGAFPSISALVLRTNRRPPATLEPDWVSGVAFLIPADIFRTLGGFDERFFMYFEDIDLCRRVRAAGHRIVRVPSATVVHQLGASQETSKSAHSQYLASQDAYARAADWPPWKIVLLRCLRFPIALARARTR